MTFHDDLADALDDIAGFGWTDITYNGAVIKAGVSYGMQRKGLAGVDGVADEAFITVRRADIGTTAKGTPVIIDGSAWKVDRLVSGGRLAVSLALVANDVPRPRRSL